jgi:hypothetical protein
MVIVGEDGIGFAWRQGVFYAGMIMMTVNFVLGVSSGYYCISMYRRIILQTALDI